MASGTQMNLGVLVTPYINQQALNGMASSAGAQFATQFNSAVSRSSQPLGRITGQVSEFEKSMAAANARVLAFGAAAGSIYLVHDAFKRMVTSTIEVEKALADINVVLGLGQTALKSFSSSMFKAAAETGQTFETASKVALEFARHGVSATETTKRMVSAMQLMRISSLNAGQAVNAITAAINAFNKEGITSEDIVSRMTAVDTKFAVSAQDLARAIERVGSTAVDAGVKFNQLLALVTAAQAATSRGGAVIGNALKSIFTRLSRPEVLSDLESVGIVTKNAAGQVEPMIEIMKRLAKQYDNLSFAQKSFVSEAVGGVYQVNILKAELADLGRGFSLYDKAVIAASNSSGLIEKRMASLNDTIASKLNTSALKLTEFFATFGQTGFGAGAKKAFDSFNNDMQFLIDGLADATDTDGVGTKIGKSIAQGIVKGIGDIISGPGVQMGAMLLARLTRGLAAFTYKSGREVLGMNDGEHKQAAIQQSINSFLQSNVGLVQAWARGQINLNQLSAVYLKNLQAANMMQARLSNVGSGAASLVGGSVSYTPAAGYIPNFRIASEDDARTERRLALAHGYEAGPVVRKVVWDGHGGAELTSINQREALSEKVINGHRGSFVVPPNGFGKGTMYAANGFVPNFSAITPEALGSFSSGKELLKYVKSLGIRGSKGSSRMFIPLDENRGIKIAMNKAGVAQNEVEFPILNHDYFAAEQYSDILPKGFGYDENNFLWGVVERIAKGTSRDFQKITGKPRRDFLFGKNLSSVEEKIEDFAGNYGLVLGDFRGGRNVGIGKVPSTQGDLFEQQMVKGVKLFDVGFNEDVQNRFYRSRDLGKFAGGFVPNFNILSAVSEALKREGTSTAAVGVSPQLRSASNPMGFGVYDKSYQRNLSDAFSQHRALGQTDFKNMGKAGGFVPNFSVETSLVIGTLQGTITNLNNVLAPLTLGYNKQLEAIRKVNVEYSTTIQKLREGGRAKYNGKTYDASAGGADMQKALNEFGKDFRANNPKFTASPSVHSQVEQAYGGYREFIGAKQARISQAGTYGMIGGPMVGEFGASLAKNLGYQNISKGLEVFSEGIMTAGQVLSAFPNKIGIGLAVGMSFKSLADSVSITTSHFGELQKAYDLASTKAERMASAGNSVLESFEKLKNASMDASVDLDDYRALQQHHNKALAELSAVPNGGAELARKLTTAPNESKMRQAVAEAVNAQNKEKGELGVRMNLAQVKATTSFAGFQYRDTFNFGNDVDKLQKQQLLRETSGQLLQSTLDSDKMPEGFSDRMKKGALNGSDIDSFVKQASGNSILSGLNPEEVKLAISHLTFELNKFRIPEGVSPDDWENHIEKLKQLSAKEMSLRERYNVELQNVFSKGAILANFVSQTTRGGIESKFRKTQFGTFGQEKEADLSALVTADAPMIAIRSKIKEQQIRNQMQRDLAENYNRGGAVLSQAFAGATKEYATSGQNTTTDKKDAQVLNPHKMAQLNFLSENQAKLAGDPQRLLKLASANNADAFAEAFIGKRKDVVGQGKMFTPFEYDTLSNKLATAVNGQQEHITEVLNATKSITEKGLYDLREINVEQLAAIKEARFKELSGAIKGIDELQHGGARKLRRELRRDEYIVAHGRNDIRRGEAARELLGYIPSDERDYKNPYVRNLYNTASHGSATAFDYIFGGTGLEGFAHSDERAKARTFGNYRGVNMPMEGMFASSGQPPIDTTQLEKSVNEAGRDIENFGKMLRTIGEPLISLKAAMDAAMNDRKNEGNKNKPTVSDGDEPTGKKSNRTVGFLAEYGPQTLGTLIGVLSALTIFKGGGKAFANVFKAAPAAANAVGSGASAASSVASAAAAGVTAAATENVVTQVTTAATRGATQAATQAATKAATQAVKAGGAVSGVTAGAAQATLQKTLNFSFLQKLTNLDKVGSFTNPQQNQTILNVLKTMNKGQFSQFSKEIGGGGAALRNMLQNGNAQIYNSEAKAILNAPTFQKMIQQMVSGAKVSGGPMGKFLMPATQSFQSTMAIAKQVASFENPTQLAGFNSLLNPLPKVNLSNYRVTKPAALALSEYQQIPRAGGSPFGKFQRIPLPNTISEAPTFRLSDYQKIPFPKQIAPPSGLLQDARGAFSKMNPLAGFKEASLLGKGARVLGAAGTLYGGYEAVNNFRKGQTSEGIAGTLTTVGSLIPGGALPVIAANIAGRSFNYGVNKALEVNMARNDARTGGILADQRANVVARNGAEAKRIAGLGSKASPEEAEYLNRYRSMTGATFKNEIAKATTREAGETFANRKSDWLKFIAAPDQTLQRGNKTFGLFGGGGMRMDWHEIHDVNKYHQDRERQFQEVTANKAKLARFSAEAERYAAYDTLRQYGNYAPESVKKYAQQMANVQGPQKAPDANNQKQQVSIEAKPVELSLKVTNENNQEIANLKTTVEWLVQSVNQIKGTPKPVAVS